MLLAAARSATNCHSPAIEGRAARRGAFHYVQDHEAAAEWFVLWCPTLARVCIMCRKESRGFTLIELLIVVGLISVIGTIATPLLFAARVSANEASAIASVRTVVSAQHDFSSLTSGFADDLATLATLCPGMDYAFISADLNANGVMKSGYRFTLAPGLGAMPRRNDCFGNLTHSTFYVTAVPQSASSGQRAFASNTIAAIWQDTSGVAPTEPFTSGGTVSPLGR